MKFMIIIEKMVVLYLFMFLFPVLANNFSELRARFSNVNQFHASFVQKIVDSTGALLQENSGELWVQRPNFFNYHTIFPEESYLISNGEILWFYDPSLNQVIIRLLKNVFDNTLLKLLFIINGEELNCSEYDIERDEDTFSLIIKNNDRNIILKKIIIKINHQGILREFSILNKENQCIQYTFNNHNMCEISVDKFKFRLPDGVVVDEQR